MNPEDIRERAVCIAQSFVGTGASLNDPTSRARYLDIIAPGETQGQRAALAAKSGCGLVVGGIWRELGVNASELDPPYKDGSAVSRLVAIARHAGAWMPFSEHTLPSAGDAVLVGDGPGEIEHIYTVVRVAEDSGVVIVESVDGGQRDEARQQTILAKKRVWKNRKDIVITGSDPGANAQGGRTITGWIDVTRLPIVAEDVAETSHGA